MVSTRQMTIGHNGAGEGSSQSSYPEGPAKFTRNSTTLAHFSPTTVATVQSCKALPTFSVQSVQFLDLPQEVTEKIFSYLKFRNVCQLRLVCRKIDSICGQILNSTFLKLQNQMLQRFQEIKSKMPRRESARRSHHLACESDIIETLHMRLTLLQMTFGKHIERRHCCFFPGEILDEVYNILYYIKTTPKLDLPYKVTDELFDLSTMAMEYFKEKIEPNLPEIAYFSADFLNFSGTFASSNSSKYMSLDSASLAADPSKGSDSNDNDDSEDLVETMPQSNMVLRKRIRKIKQGMKRYNSQLSVLRQDLRSCKKKTAEQQKQMSEQQKQLADQQKQTLEYATRLDEYDKKNEEISRKFSTLLQELNKCKTELQYWRCKSPATPPVCAACGTPVGPPPEELQALMNQGVDVEGLGLAEPGEAAAPATAGTPEQSSGSEDDTAKEKDREAPKESDAATNQIKGAKRKLDETKDEKKATKNKRLSKKGSKRVKI